MKKIKTLLLAMLISSISFATPKAFAQLISIDNACYVVLIYVADVDNNGNIDSILVTTTVRLYPEASGLKIGNTNSTGDDFNKALNFPEINQAVRDELNSEIIKKNYPIDENTLTLFPNPSNNSVEVSVNLKQESTLNLLLFSLQGALIDIYNAGKLSGLQTIRYRIPEKVKAGQYMLVIQAGDQNTGKKLILQ